MLFNAIQHTLGRLNLPARLDQFRDIFEKNSCESIEITALKRSADNAGVSTLSLPLDKQWLLKYDWEQPLWITEEGANEVHIIYRNEKGFIEQAIARNDEKISISIVAKEELTQLGNHYASPIVILWLGDAGKKAALEEDVILFEPDERWKGRPLRRFFRMLRPDRKDIGYIYLYAILAGLINLSLPLGIQAIINLINSGEITTSWYVLIFFILTGIILTGAFQIMQLSIIEIMQQRVFVRAAFQFARKIPRLDIEALGRSYPPELMNRFFDILTVQKGLSKILMDFSTSTLQIIFGLVLLSLYHPFFIAFGFALLLVLFVIFRYSSKAGMVTSLEESKYKYQVVFWLEEVARNLIGFKLSGNESLVSQRTDDLVSGYLKFRKAHFRVLIFQFGTAVAFKALVTGGLLIMGSLLVMDQQMNIGQFVAAEIVIILLLVAVEKLIRTMETVYDVLTGTEKIGQVIDLQEENQTGVSFSEHDTGRGLKLELNKLTYTFPDNDSPVLNKLNLVVQSGERVCISGTNGSGKSTLMKILSGSFTKYQGQYLINDIPANNYLPRTVRNAIGDNLSDEDIFNGSLSENLSMGRTYITRPQMLNTLEVVGLADFVKELPFGLDTIIGAEDNRFTPTIRRKIVLARSIVCKPRLLVIDDYLLNAEQERKETIARYLTQENDNWTLVVVSNNSYMAECCDRVIILDKGELVAEGKPDEIMKSEYSVLFHSKKNRA